MSRNLSASTDLATKYFVGEIADFVGVSNYYDAGTSQWMKTGTWVAASSLSSGVKSTLLSASYNYVALTENTLVDETNAQISGATPPAIVGTTRCFAYASNARSSLALACLTVNANGISLNPLNQVAGYANHGDYCGGNAITSDGTTFWSWTAASASAFAARTSTDGITWSSATLTGQASFAGLTSHSINLSGSQNGYQTSLGISYQNFSTYGLVAAYCGARHLLIGLNGSNQYLAQRSTDGLAWGGDETTTILGSATLAASKYSFFYRNGNTFYLSLDTTSGPRKTTDGGATWASATNALGARSTVFHRINSSDATRLAAATTSGTAMAFSADSGATWTTRTAPFTLGSAGGTAFYGMGASWVICDRESGLTYKTTNDGANWTQITAPTGFTGAIHSVCADAYRWYLFSADGNQVATSTDLTTWTVRNISNSAPSSIYTSAPNFIAATDSNTLFGCAPLVSIISSDGGVTWTWLKTSSATTATGVISYAIANTTGTSCFISGQTHTSSAIATVVTAAAVAAGGASYRVSTSAVTPLRTNALAYSRVA